MKLHQSIYVLGIFCAATMVGISQTPITINDLTEQEMNYYIGANMERSIAYKQFGEKKQAWTETKEDLKELILSDLTAMEELSGQIEQALSVNDPEVLANVITGIIDGVFAKMEEKKAQELPDVITPEKAREEVTKANEEAALTDEQN